jgi:hypothetical protein
VDRYYDEGMSEVVDGKGNKAWQPVEDGGVITCCSGQTVRIHMRMADVGVYFDDAGHEVSEEIAQAAGFDVDRYRALRRERGTLAQARESVAALRGEPPKVEAPKPTLDELRAKVQELTRKPWVNQPSYVMLPNEKMNRHAIKAQSTPVSGVKWLDADGKLANDPEMIRKVREAGQS